MPDMIVPSADPEHAERLMRVRTDPCTRCGGAGCMVCEILACAGIWPADKPLPKVKR